jgi:hypothetical protein
MHEQQGSGGVHEWNDPIGIDTFIYSVKPDVEGTTVAQSV